MTTTDPSKEGDLVPCPSSRARKKMEGTEGWSHMGSVQTSVFVTETTGRGHDPLGIVTYPVYRSSVTGTSVSCPQESCFDGRRLLPSMERKGGRGLCRETESSTHDGGDPSGGTDGFRLSSRRRRRRAERDLHPILGRLSVE